MFIGLVVMIGFIRGHSIKIHKKHPSAQFGQMIESLMI